MRNSKPIEIYAAWIYVFDYFMVQVKKLNFLIRLCQQSIPGVLGINQRSSFKYTCQLIEQQIKFNKPTAGPCIGSGVQLAPVNGIEKCQAICLNHPPPI